jgi:hypothetical protein
MNRLSTFRLILSTVLISIAVVLLFYAEDFWTNGEHRRGKILALTGLVPLIWGFWLRRKKKRVF